MNVAWRIRCLLEPCLLLLLENGAIVLSDAVRRLVPMSGVTCLAEPLLHLDYALLGALLPDFTL